MLLTQDLNKTIIASSPNLDKSTQMFGVELRCKEFEKLPKWLYSAAVTENPFPHFEGSSYLSFPFPEAATLPEP